MSNQLLNTVAQSFSLSSDALVEQGLKAFLLDQLALLNSEFQSLLAQHRVHSFEEFDKLLIAHPERESALLSDFQHADFLSSRISDIKHWLNQLNGNH
ncbi:MAG: hypothetical protein HY960_14880 [Ignavibacteriae bacterium]|nr:hypothetical protein [Ignavibacteriota bacterium]